MPSLRSGTTPADQEAEHSQTTTNIAEDGDVVLVFTSSRIRVYSTILSSMSGTFEAMFRLPLREGTAPRSAQYPIEIFLEEDNASAMTKLCTIAHQKRDPYPYCPESQSNDKAVVQAVEVAKLGDKYCCHAEVMKLVSNAVLSQFYDSPDLRKDPQNLLHLVAAAYLFDNRRHFAHFTRWLIMMCTGLCSDLRFHSAFETLPHLVLSRYPTLPRLCLML